MEENRRIMRKDGIISRFRWYPPAETYLSNKLFVNCLRTIKLADVENRLCEATGTNYCRLGPSGKSLLHSLLSSLSEKDKFTKNEVLIPGYTCYSVAASIVKSGLKIRLYDLNPKTLNPVYRSLEEKLNDKTLAVITQHLLGVPSDAGAINDKIKNTGAWHIEDAAQGMGGLVNGKCVGSLADYGLLSFGRGKPLPLGGGGAIVSKNHDVKKIVGKFETYYGIKYVIKSFITQILAKPAIYGIAEKLPLGLGKTVFDRDFNIGKIPASLIQLILPAMIIAKSLNQRRRAVSDIYRKNIIKQYQIDLPKSIEANFIRYPVLGKKGSINKDLYRMGVRRLYPHSLNQEPLVRKYIQDYEGLKGVEKISHQLITLPTNVAVSTQTAEEISKKVNRWIEE